MVPMNITNRTGDETLDFGLLRISMPLSLWYFKKQVACSRCPEIKIAKQILTDGIDLFIIHLLFVYLWKTQWQTELRSLPHELWWQMISLSYVLDDLTTSHRRLTCHPGRTSLCFPLTRVSKGLRWCKQTQYLNAASWALSPDSPLSLRCFLFSFSQC